MKACPECQARMILCKDDAELGPYWYCAECGETMSDEGDDDYPEEEIS